MNLQIGTQLIGRGSFRSIHTIDDIIVTDDGETLYRAAPYMVYKTAEEIEKDFVTFTRPTENKPEEPSI